LTKKVGLEVLYFTRLAFSTAFCFKLFDKY
jgi:hypothetical protein